MWAIRAVAVGGVTFKLRGGCEERVHRGRDENRAMAFDGLLPTTLEPLRLMFTEYWLSV